MTQYRVVGPLAIVTQTTQHGPFKMHLHTGALIGPGMTDKERDHNLDMRLIAPVEEPARASVPETASETERATVEPEPDEEPDDTGDVEAARAAAAAQLPADGSAPDGRKSRAVWIEYGVAKGYKREELETQDRAELIELLRGRG